MKLKNNSVLYPGSFDPLTYGHIGTIRRFAPFFEPFVVLVSSSLYKTYWFSLEEREQMVREALKEEFPQVQVRSYWGLTADFAKKNHISLILRGIRSLHDLNYERDVAVNNKKIFKEIETLLAFSDTGQELISSKLVKEMAIHKESLENFVPQNVKELIERKIKERETGGSL